MPEFDWTLALVLVATSLGTAILALLVMGAFQPARRVIWAPLKDQGDTIVFLFRDHHLMDATDEARRLLDAGPEFLAHWPRLLAVLQKDFPDLPDAVANLSTRQHVELAAPDSDDFVEAEWRGGLVRITLRRGHDADAFTSGDKFSQAALAEELGTLRGVIDNAPMLVWKEDFDGAVRWANGAYVDLANRLSGEAEAVGWPLPRVFENRPSGADESEGPRRLSIRLPGSEDPVWFDCYEEHHGEEALVFAIPADRLVRAEGTLREFVQTLTKTFAHLPTGLAVFDRDRRMALFNPALTDLSGLEPLFLSGRPTLFEFLDRLREKQRMPEPKDYKTWRRTILDLESAAASGTHQETWSLPTGQTFRVTGRPHPDGAIAFLFEDISAEISLTRRFRAELELGQSVVDSLDEAIAVFSSSGSLVLANTAYEELWADESDTSVADVSIVEATRAWQTRCTPSPTWGDLRDFVGEAGERAEWSAEVEMLDGTHLACRFTPLCGHATLAGFTPISRPRAIAPIERSERVMASAAS